MLAKFMMELCKFSDGWRNVMIIRMTVPFHSNILPYSTIPDARAGHGSNDDDRLWMEER